jgi:ketosteroid isomerase-like protein
MMDTYRRMVPARLACALAIALAVMIATGCGPDRKELIRQAQKVDAKFQKAFAAEDVDGLMTLYWNDPEVVMIPIGGPIITGSDGIRKQFQNFFDGTNVKSFSFGDQHYQVLGDSVLGWGTWKIETDPSLGPAAKIEGRYTEVVAKRDGEWVYVFDNPSVEMTPDESAASMKAIEMPVPETKKPEK